MKRQWLKQKKIARLGFPCRASGYLILPRRSVPRNCMSRYPPRIREQIAGVYLACRPSGVRLVEMMVGRFSISRVLTTV